MQERSVGSISPVAAFELRVHSGAVTGLLMARTEGYGDRSDSGDTTTRPPSSAAALDPFNFAH